MNPYEDYNEPRICVCLDCSKSGLKGFEAVPGFINELYYSAIYSGEKLPNVLNITPPLHILNRSASLSDRTMNKIR